MAQQEAIHDSPKEWVAEHIHNYVESDGSNGQLWNGLPSLLLTTRGRKSGLLRRTAVFYAKDGDHYIIGAANGGSPHLPEWYLNLSANPDIEVQVGADKFSAIARTATSEERARLWPLLIAVTNLYAEFQTKAERETPVVMLVRK